MDFDHPLRVVTPTLEGDVLAVLAAADDEFSGRRIHRLLGHGSEPGIRKAVERLVDQGVVLRRPAGRANLYRLNREHIAAPHVEGLAAMRLQLLSRLRAAMTGWRLQAHSALLFGSVARGEGGVGSDLDLLVIRPSDIDEEALEWREQLAALERDATGWTGNDTRILEYGEEEISGVGAEPVIDDALAEGIELFGSRHGLRSLLRGHPA